MISDNPSQFLRDAADLVTRLTENAEQQQTATEKAISRLNGVATQHATLQSAALKELDLKINEAMGKAASLVTVTITKKLEDANLEAERASARYKKAGRTIGFRALIVIALVFIGAIASTEFFLWNRYPNSAEMAMLQRSIDKGVLKTCPENKQAMCILIEEPATQKRYWETLPQ